MGIGNCKSVNFLLFLLQFKSEKISLSSTLKSGRLPHSNRHLSRRFSFLPPPFTTGHKSFFPYFISIFIVINIILVETSCSRHTKNRRFKGLWGFVKGGTKQKRVALLFHSAPQLSLCAKELVCLVRFSRATSALEPPPCAAVLLPSAALLQLNRSCSC